MDTKKLLTQRRKTHGRFLDNRNLVCELMKIIDSHSSETYKSNPEIGVSILYIIQKLTRIITGDPNFIDHWDDLAGYAILQKTILTHEQNIYESMEPSNFDYIYENGVCRKIKENSETNKIDRLLNKPKTFNIEKDVCIKKTLL